MPLFFTALLYVLLATTPALAQRLRRVDFREVQDRTMDSNSPFFFPTLLGRLQKVDTTLNRQEYYYLYYGQVFAAGYQPYDADELSDEFRIAFECGQFEQALATGLPELAAHPFNPKLRQQVLVCLSHLGRRAEAVRYSKALFGFLYTIIGSGDGHSASTAFVPVSVADEYAVLGYYNLKWSRHVQQSTTDSFVLTGTHAPPRDERHSFVGNLIYFDISRPQQHLKALFKKKQ